MFWHRMLGKHFRKPQGWLGHWAVRFMEKNNRDYYTRVIELLAVNDEDHILEIGFGSGLAIKQIMEQNQCCRVQGIDFSELMFKKAIRNNRISIEQKRLHLILGAFGEHEFGANTYSKIFAINVLYFWENLSDLLAKTAGLLRPGGRLVLYLSSPERLNQIPFAVDGVFNKYPASRIVAELKRAEFENVNKYEVEKNGLPTYYICAEK